MRQSPQVHKSLDGCVAFRPAADWVFPRDWIVFWFRSSQHFIVYFPGGQTSSAVDLLGFNQLQARKLQIVSLTKRAQI